MFYTKSSTNPHSRGSSRRARPSRKVKVESRKNKAIQQTRLHTNQPRVLRHAPAPCDTSIPRLHRPSLFVRSLSFAPSRRSIVLGSRARLGRFGVATTRCRRRARVQRCDRTNGDLSEMRVFTSHILKNPLLVRFNRTIADCALRRRTTRTTRTTTTTRQSHATATCQSRVRRVNLI